MSKAAIFIDGGYLSKVLQNEFSSATINLEEFSKTIADKYPRLRTYYYNCMPHKSATPTHEQIERYSNMQKFITSLEKYERFEVRLGKLKYCGNDNTGKPIFQQKRVDILLGCDLVLLAAKNRISQAFLVTGDSDFIPAVQIAKNEGVEIILVHSNLLKPNQDLYTMADERMVITEEIILKSKFLQRC